jgi:spore germination protein GerM
MSNQIEPRSIIAAGKATANQTDQQLTIDTTFGGFRKVTFNCTGCTTDTMFSIGQPVSTSNKIIYVPAGQVYDENLAGGSIYYSCATGTNTFYYVLL